MFKNKGTELSSTSKQNLVLVSVEGLVNSLSKTDFFYPDS